MPNERNRRKLTKTLIVSLHPQSKEYAVWDSECPGFGVRVLPSGRKSYFVMYRDERRRTKRQTLGAVDTKDVSSARKEARQALADIERGVNPFMERKRLNGVPLLSDFWEVYLEQHARPTKAKSSVESDKSLWRNRVQPEFGKTPLNEILRRDVSAWHKREKHNPIAANRALMLLSRIMTLAKEHEYVDHNPCSDVRKNAENPRCETLSRDEVRALISAIDADHDKSAATMAKLLLYTGARRGEALKAKWSDFDLDEGIWKVPQEHIKGGVRRNIQIERSLSKSAIEAIDDWQKLSGNSDGWVFPSLKDPSVHRYDIKRFWDRVRERSGFHSIRTHDLRHAFASLALEGGMTLDKVGLEMGHRSTQTTLRYAHLVKRRDKTAADVVAEMICRE